MRQNLLDHHRIFNAGDHLHRAIARLAGRDVNLEYPLQSLRLRLIAARQLDLDARFGGWLRANAPAPFTERALPVLRAVGREHAMVAGEVHPGVLGPVPRVGGR